MRLLCSVVVGCLLLHDACGSDLKRLVLFSPDYSIHEAPSTDDGSPLPVRFSVNLRNVLGVSEKEQLITIEISLRMFWRDHRLRMKAQDKEYVTLNPLVHSNFWIPDVFIDRAKDIRIPTYVIRPASLRIYKVQFLLPTLT